MDVKSDINPKTMTLFLVVWIKKLISFLKIIIYCYGYLKKE